IDIAVVGQHAGDNYGQRSVFVGAVAVIGDRGAGSSGRIVDRGDGDGDGGSGGAVGLAVVGFVSEAVRPVVIERRGVSETAIVVQVQCAVSRTADKDRSERIAINIGVVGQYARCGHCQGRVFRRGVNVIVDDAARGPGRIVDRSGGDGDGG